MILLEHDLQQIKQEKLTQIFASVHGVSQESAQQTLNRQPCVGAAVNFDTSPSTIRPPKYLERIVGRFYGRDDIRIRCVEVAQLTSTIVVGLAATIDDNTELVLSPDHIIHFKEEVFYDAALRLNHESGEVYIDTFAPADVVRYGRQAPFVTHVRKLPLKVVQGLNGILSRTNPKYIDI